MVTMNESPDPVTLLQTLIRFDTTNPPGNEGPCIAYIRDLLVHAGIATTLLGIDPNRPNLIARLPGRGEAPPILMYGHVDVVTAAAQRWTHPPFEGLVKDGFIWGRGALDMKSGIAMMLTAMLRATAEGFRPPGDVILAVVSDEEAGSDTGARYLVENHASQFDGVRYAIGEFGGFTFHIGNRVFYPIMVAEKQGCWMKATLRGPGGHGSLPVRGGAMAKLGQVLTRLDRKQLPVHVTEAGSMMVTALAEGLGGAQGALLKLVLQPAATDLVLRLLGERARLFYPLLHNTVSPTMVSGSDKINVIPDQVEIGLDGRLLPGQHPEDLLRELRAVLGDEMTFEILQYDPVEAEPDLGLFDTLADILREADPGGIPIPYLLSGITDGRFFSRIGIQTYGFTPMQLPRDFKFTDTVHAADERIPLEAVDFGARAIYELLRRLPSHP